MIESSGGVRELYDLSHDPEELVDLATGQRARVRALSRRLRSMENEHPPLFTSDEQNRQPLRKETTEALRALGYLE